MVSMLSHFLNPVQGPWTPDGNYTFRAKIADTVLDGMGTLYAGRAVHVAVQSGELVFKTGVHDTGMTYFFFPRSSDDVQDGSGNPATDSDAYAGFATEGVGVALPASSGYELLTSEYLVGGTFTPGATMLTAEAADATLATGGVLKPGTAYVHSCCGVVSQGLIASGYGGGILGLAFHACYLPRLKSGAIASLTA